LKFLIQSSCKREKNIHQEKKKVEKQKYEQDNFKGDEDEDIGEFAAFQSLSKLKIEKVAPESKEKPSKPIAITKTLSAMQEYKQKVEKGVIESDPEFGYCSKCACTLLFEIRAKYLKLNSSKAPNPKEKSDLETEYLSVLDFCNSFERVRENLIHDEDRDQTEFHPFSVSEALKKGNNADPLFLDLLPETKRAYWLDICAGKDPKQSKNEKEEETDE
jgi:hypothetical protein